MVEDSPSVHDLLQQLEQEVASDAATGPEHQERVERLAVSIRDRLDKHFDEDLQAELLDEVDAAVTHFEVAHPTLTATLQRLAVALSNVGI